MKIQALRMAIIASAMMGYGMCSEKDLSDHSLDNVSTSHNSTTHDMSKQEVVSEQNKKDELKNLWEEAVRDYKETYKDWLPTVKMITESAQYAEDSIEKCIKLYWFINDDRIRRSGELQTTPKEIIDYMLKLQLSQTEIPETLSQEIAKIQEQEEWEIEGESYY